MNNISTVILAAGKSSRFKHVKSKLLTNLSGLPIILHIVQTAKKISGNNIIVVCNKDNISELKKKLPNCKFVIQKKQKGTADAILTAKKLIKTNLFLILFADTPLVSLKSLKKLVQNFKQNKSYGSMIAFKSSKPYGYGRLKINENKVSEVIEEINASKEEKKITLCYSGVMIVNFKFFFKYLKLIKINRVKNEKYLPDIFKIFAQKNIPFNFIRCPENEMLGINTLEDFSLAEKIHQKNIINKFLKSGVLFQKPDSCYLSHDTKIEKGVIIEQNVTIHTKTIIKKGTIVKSHSYLEGVTIEENCVIGPSARIRPNSFIKKNSKIGNFVEVKNSEIGQNVSIAHLSYVGDAKIGNKVNIGASTITCNYDGKRKHKTIIKDGAFIGSHSSLIAPLIINKNAKIAAGSVINVDIPSNCLGITRPKLKIIKKN